MPSSTASHGPELFSAEKRRVRRGETRRCEVAAVALRIFLERGYAQTTMQAIAEQAGASKETLYRHFGSKEGLFTEIVKMKSEQIAESLDENMALHASPRDILLSVGLNLLKTLICGDVLSFYGWVVAETPRAPEVGRLFYETGPAVLRTKLTEYLEKMTARGILRCENAPLAAKLFLGATLADVHLRAMTMGIKQMSVADMNEQAAGAVEMFMARFSATA